MNICSSHELLMNQLQRATFDDVCKREGHAAAWEAAIKKGGVDGSEQLQDFNVYKPEDEFTRLTKMKMEVELNISRLTARKDDVKLKLKNLKVVQDDVESELVAMKRKSDDLDGELCALEKQVAGRKRTRLTDDPCAKILFACEICGMIPIYVADVRIRSLYKITYHLGLFCR
jgi:hypothetical protein